MESHRGAGDKDVFAVLMETSRRLQAGAPLEAVLDEIAQASVDLVGGHLASVLLLQADGRTLLCGGAVGLPEGEARRLTFTLGEGVAGWVALHGTPVRLPDVSADPRFARLEGLPYEGSLCCVPLTARDEVIGVLSVSSSQRGGFSEESEQLLRFLAAALIKDLETARLYRLAVTDPLTGAFNRQWLAENLQVELDRHRRYDRPLSLLMVDTDLLKQINDRHGHAAGDEVLRALSDRVRATLREVDRVVRYGGDEFLVLLPETDGEGALRVAERVRERVQATPVRAHRSLVDVTVSVGVAQRLPEDLRAGDLVARADSALYRAKSRGRNQAVMA